MILSFRDSCCLVLRLYHIPCSTSQLYSVLLRKRWTQFWGIMALIDDLNIVTWNIAAINNNPFEYYTTVDHDVRYDELMKAVESFIQSPGERDIVVREVFTPDMFQTLKTAMIQEEWNKIQLVEAHWENDLSQRRIVTGFLQDRLIGAKRLASMPDRVTNTIYTTGRQVMCRPTVINNYRGAMPSTASWFEQWMSFIFAADVPVPDNGGICSLSVRKVCSMLAPIKRAKYPEVTPEEEEISIPLQTLYLAVFDAIDRKSVV